MTKIIVKHLSGSKVNQVDQFRLGDFSELLMGRDPSCAVTFDAARDETVSRRHAVITVIRHDPLTFTIADCGSANGTFVGGRLLTEPMELTAGDVIELGQNGPRVQFDVEPRPPHMMPRTREIAVPGGETRVAAAAGWPEQPSPSPMTGIGRKTLEREIRQGRNQGAAMALGGAALLMALVGGVLFYLNRTSEERIATAVEATRADIASTATQVADTQHQIEESQAALNKRIGKLTRQEIAARFARSTVLVETSWRLHDRTTGRPVFHRCVTREDRCRPLLVRLPDGQLVRWLTTDDEDRSNLPIAHAIAGSGVVVTKDGFILTNKHVASPWLVGYGWGSDDAPVTASLVVPYGKTLADAGPLAETDIGALEKLARWIPADGAPLFQARRAEFAAEGMAPFDGRAETIGVRFAGESVSSEARLVRTSADADVALIRIEVPETLRPVELAPVDHRPALGEPVTVIGYPAFSAQRIEVRRTAEAGELRNAVALVPEPTVADGVVAKVGGALVMADGASSLSVGTMGDVYQLSVTATGPGGSGGPVIDTNGRLLGLVTYVVRGDAGERAVYAVPSHHAHAILRLPSASN